MRFTLPVLLALGLLAPRARAHDAVWDADPLSAISLPIGAPRALQARMLQQRQSSVQVFVAPSFETPGLQAAVESFLDALLVRRDLDAALKPLSKSVDDAGFSPEVGLRERDALYPFSANYNGEPTPITHEQARADWRLQLKDLLEEFDPEVDKGVPQPKTLAAAITKLASEGPLARDLRAAVGSRSFVVPLGERLLAFPVRYFSDLEWIGEGERNEDMPLAWKARLPKILRDGNLDMRAVVAVRRYDWLNTPYVLEIVMLWAKEDGGWKLWGVVPIDRQPPDMKPQ
jgi:hypothetical protein